MIASLLDSPNGKVAFRREAGDKDGIRVTANLSIRLGLLETTEEATQRWRPNLEVEPLVDVFETKAGRKIMIALPGIRKEDVRFGMADGFLELEIRRGSKLFRRRISCSSPPSSVRIKSVVENNSVLEITFAKGRARRVE